jgi:hypothetical protein
MPAAAIQRALAKKIELDLAAVPLSEAMAAIKRQTNLEIRIAPDALIPKDDEKPGSKAADKTDKPAGKPSDKPTEKPTDKPADKPASDPTGNVADKLIEKVTDRLADKRAVSEPIVSAHLKGISAASALNLVLRDVELSWSIDHGGILVASADQLPVTTAVYDVRDLVVAHPSFDSHDDSVEFQYDPLIGLVTGVIQCPAWSGDVEKVQDCNPFHGTLTVRQDQQVQQKVAGLLAALRKARGLPAAQFNPSTNLGLGIVGADDSVVAAALDANVEAAFNDAKLEQVVEWIRRSCGIPVHVDSAVPLAVQDSQSFTLKASGVPLRAMLKALLPQAKLGFNVADETLVITTQDTVSDLRSIRVYPVGDLIAGEVDQHGVDDDYAQLLDSITHNVQPESWAPLDRQKPSNSGGGSAYAAYLPAGRAVVFDQTSSAHEEIAATLAKLRAAVALQPAAVKPSAGGEKPEADKLGADKLGADKLGADKLGADKLGADKPARRFLSMRIYKLNPDLPADDFVAVVRDLIEPKSWTGETYLHGVPGAIVVKQTPAVHKRIERLLIELGAIPDPKKSGASGTPILIGKHKRA